MTDEQIKAMVNRFLQWKLPEDFHPDCGIKFDANEAVKINPQNRKYEPVGTNLFTSCQAEAMIRYILAAPPVEEENALEKTANAFFDAFDKLMDKQDLYPDDLAEKRGQLIAAILTHPSKQESAWQDISTAPKDKKTYFLAIDRNGKHWIGHMFEFPNTDVGWKFTAHAIIIDATDWQPLPEKPK